MPDNIGQKTELNDFGFGNNEKSADREDVLAEPDIAIHTMPKRFLVSEPSSKKARGIGLLIFTGGGIILSLAVAFLYYYLTNSELPFLNDKPAAVINSGAGADQPPAASIAEISDREKPAATPDEAGSNLAVNENSPAAASATPLIASSVPIAADENEPASSTSATQTIKGLSPGSSAPAYIYPDDADKDGLFDVEEALFGCNVSASDSDGDGYSDLAELLGLYNPAGAGGIIVNQNIEKYINGKYGYSLYYPYVWQAEKINGDDSMIFKLGNNQFIQIIVQPNSAKQFLNDWYKENSGNEVINNSQILYKKGWAGVRSNDGLNAYLTKDNLNTILIVSYSLGTSNVANYKNVFDMMVNSLEIN